MAYNQQRTKKQDYDEAYMQAWQGFGSWQTEAKRDIQSYLGDIFTADEKKKLKLRGSDILNIQLIRRLIKWIAGYQIDNRKGIKYDPIEGSDDTTASDFTELLVWVMQRAHGYEIISKAFEHALKTGLCLVNSFNDANRDTFLEHFFYNQFLLDPNFTRLDLKDCRYGMLRKYISKGQAKMLLPEEMHAKIDAMDDERPRTDEKFPNYTTPLLHGLKMIAYDEFQERTTKEEIVIINKIDGSETIWNGTKAQLEEQLPLMLYEKQIPPEIISTITRRKETVEVSAFLNGEHFATELDPFGIEDFSFTPIWCFYDPEYDRFEWKLQGLVRSLKEIQRAESKRIIALIAWYENSIANGLDFEEETLVDPEDAFATGIKPRMFKKGALTNNAARDRQVPPPPPGQLELHQILEGAMSKTIGINPDMLGEIPDAKANQISGLVTQLRIGAGMIGTRGLFDDLSTAQNIIGVKIQRLMQQYDLEKVKRILGREPSPAFYTGNFGKYDSVTSESPMTDTQINTKYQEMLLLKRMGSEMGDPSPISWADLLEVAPIEMNAELLQKLQKREQASMQQQQMQAQQQAQIQAITIELLGAQAAQARAKASESPAQVIKILTEAEANEAKSQNAVIDIQGTLANNLIGQAIKLQELNFQRNNLTNRPVSV